MTRVSRTKIFAAIAALLVSMVWGLSFVVVKDVVELLPPLSFIAARYVVAVAVILPICWRRLRRQDWRRMLGAAFQVGAPLGAAQALQVIGAQHTTASNSALITGLYIVLVPLVGLAFGQAVTKRQMGIALLAFAGLALFTLDAELRIATGDWWVLGAAVCFAIHFNMLGRWGARYDALTLTGMQLTAAMLLLVPAALLLAPIPSPGLFLTGPVLWPILFCGILVTVVGFGVQTAVQRVLPPAPSAVLFSSESLFGALSGVVFHQDPFLPRQILGAVILLGSMVGSVLGEQKTPPSATPATLADPATSADPDRPDTPDCCGQ